MMALYTLIFSLSFFQLLENFTFLARLFCKRLIFCFRKLELIGCSNSPLDKVNKLRLESSVERAKVKLAQMQAASFSEIENRKIQLKYAKRNNERHQALYAKNSISLFEKDKAETEVALAKVELIKARENKKIAQLNLEKAQAELELRTIKSPIDGIVVDTYARVGEFVAERTIMRLAQIDPLRVEMIVPTEYFGKIKRGMRVKIYPEHPANKTYRATVTVVDQLIDPASGSFTVRMALPNPGDKLVAGVNCIARFNF